MVCSPGDHQVRIPRVQTFENQVYVVIYAYNCIQICHIYYIRIIHTANPFASIYHLQCHHEPHTESTNNTSKFSSKILNSKKRMCRPFVRPPICQPRVHKWGAIRCICMFYYQSIILTLLWFLSLVPHVHSRAMHHPPTSLSKMIIDMDGEETGSSAVSLAG